MVEKEGKRVPVRKEDFIVSMLETKLNIYNLVAAGSMNAKDAAGHIGYIAMLLETVNQAEMNDLRVDFFLQDGQISFEAHPKRKMGFV